MPDARRKYSDKEKERWIKKFDSLKKRGVPYREIEKRIRPSTSLINRWRKYGPTGSSSPVVKKRAYKKRTPKADVFTLLQSKEDNMIVLFGPPDKLESVVNRLMGDR